jgi:hypothetical protein
LCGGTTFVPWIEMRVRPLELVLLGAAVVVAAVGVWRLLARGGGGGGGTAVLASWTRTPGALNPDVRQATIARTICVRGWTRTVRPPVSYTNALKARQLREYGLRGPLSGYQEDHLISLELGGAPVDPRNLWPEPYPRAADVDRIENELNRRVCDGSLSLAAAQATESSLKHREG